MVTKGQLNNAKELLDQVRLSVALAQENWAIFVKSKDIIFKSLIHAGVPAKEVIAELQKLIDDHHEKHLAALKHYNIATEAYVKLLNEFNSMCTDEG